METNIHEHTGLDQPKIKGNNISFFDILETIPTVVAEQGTLTVGKDTGVYKLYCMINGVWTVL
jgi:hypothetical protein